MKNYVLEITNAFTYALAFLQANETLQIIEFAISIFTSAVLIAYRIWRWYKAAKEDGKLTKEEIEEGLQIVIDGKEEIESQIADKDKRPEIKKKKGHRE